VSVVSLLDCPQCGTVAILNADDCDLLVRALSAWSSDYNDAPHDDIASLIERLQPEHSGGCTCGGCACSMCGSNGNTCNGQCTAQYDDTDNMTAPQDQRSSMSET